MVSASAPQLVYDGGCPFCRHFAEATELRGGLPNLVIRDGRADHLLRHDLNQRGYPLRNGAVLIDGNQILHGDAAIQWVCDRLHPSDPLLSLLANLFRQPERARRLYPLLLLARRLALNLYGLPVDPDVSAH